MPENFTVTFAADHVLMVAVDIKAGSRLIVKDGAIIGVLPPATSTPVAAHLEHEPHAPAPPPKPNVEAQLQAVLRPPQPKPTHPKATAAKKPKKRGRPRKDGKPVAWWGTEGRVKAEAETPTKAKAFRSTNAATDYNGPVPPYTVLYDLLTQRGAMAASAIYGLFNLPAGSTQRTLAYWRMRQMIKKGFIRDLADEGQRGVFMAVPGMRPSIEDLNALKAREPEPGEPGPGESDVRAEIEADGEIPSTALAPHE